MRLSGLSGILGGRSRIRRDPVFIFASGNRCGSTLLQRLLNSNPDVLVWGEHGGALQSVLEGSERFGDWAYDHREHSETFFRSGPDHFIPNMSPSPERIRAAARTYVEEVFADSALAAGRHIWGFKEVRYRLPVALLLQELFPEARFIHLTRRIEDCFLSMKRWELSGEWKRSWTIESLNNWALINRGFLDQGHELSQLISVRYEDMTSLSPHEFISKISDFLRLPADDFDAGVFARRLGGSTASSTAMLDPDELALVSTPEIVALKAQLSYD